MSQVRRLADRFSTLADMLRDHDSAERVRAFYFRSAVYDGLAPSDADDGAQLAMLRLYDPTPWLSSIDPAHAVYAVRRFLRKQGWKPRTGKRRSATRQRAYTPAQWRELVGRREYNPAALAVTMCTVDERLAGRLCGRNAKAIRALTRESILAEALGCRE